MSQFIIDGKSKQSSQSQQNFTLQKYLQNPNIKLPDLLSKKNIQTKIKTNLTNFIKYCQQHEQFSYNLIDYGIKYSLTDNVSQSTKNICYIATDILTCDQDIIADFFILPDKNKKVRKDSGDQSDQFQEIQENIENQTKAESEQNSAAPNSFQALNQEQIPIDKYKYLNKLIEYVLQNQANNIDQNCMNYLVKAINCVLRKKTQQFIEYLQENPKIIQKMIQLNQFSSINQFFIKILSDDELQSDDIFQLKNKIVDGVLQNMKRSVNKEEFIQRLDFLDELFQTNKYAAQEDRTQLQKLSDKLVTQQVINYFYKYYLNPSTQNQFYNSLSYLNAMIKRMNVDEQLDPYSYTNEPKQQTMLFKKMDILFKQYQIIVKKGYQNIHHVKYSEQYKKKLVEIKYYEFLINITKNSRFVNCENQALKLKNSDILKGNNIIFKNKEQKIHLIKQLIIEFVNYGKKNGINKNYIVGIIEKVLGMQIYVEENHKKSEDKPKVQQNQGQKKLHQMQSIVKIDLNGDNESKKNDSQQEHKIKLSQIHQQESTKQDKKKKINKIKAGLKLDIKKFSIQSSEKSQEQDKKQVKTEQPHKINIEKLQQSLTKEQVIELLEYLSNQLQSHHIKDLVKQKAKKSELIASINKIIIILCNSIYWNGYSRDQKQITQQKQKLIQRTQALFPTFNLQQICSNYSVTLATTKHPNNNQKSNSHPELQFFYVFFENYAPKDIKSLNNNGNKNSNNNILEDSFLKSEDDEEENVQVTKCTLDDFIKFTGFKFETKKEEKTAGGVLEVKENNGQKSPEKNQKGNKLQKEISPIPKTQNEQKHVIDVKKQPSPQKQPAIQPKNQTLSPKKDSPKQAQPNKSQNQTANSSKPTTKSENPSPLKTENKQSYYIRHIEIYV